MLWGGGYRRNNLATYLVATLFLALFSTPLLALTLTTSAYADTTPATPSATKTVDVNVFIDPVISIRALDSTGTNPISTLPLAITPTSTGAFAKNNLILQVDSTNHTGYNLYLTSDYKTDGTTSETTPATAASYTNSLVNLTYSDTITSLANTATPENPVSEANFSAANSAYQNMWGISKAWNETIHDTALSGGNIANYFSVPVNGTTTTLRDDVDTVSSDSRTSIGVGANVNTAKKVGIYKNRLVFTAVGNPLPVDYTLTFDKNTDATVANLPEPLTDTVIAQSKTFTIPDVSGSGTLPAMTRDGYQFIGWSRSATEIIGTGTGPASPTDPTQHLYVAGDSFTVLSDDQSGSGTTTRFTGTATAYAFWAQEYTYTLNYSCGEGATDCPSTQTVTSTDTSYTFTISSTTPELEGYDFVNYTDNGAGAGNEYDPGDTITLTNSASTKTLTANWEEKPKCNVSANQICYAPNADDVVGEMPNQTTVYMASSTSAGSTDSAALSSSTTEFTLYSPNFSRTGYGFAGWNTKSDGTGTMFGPNQTLTTSDSTLTSAMQSDLGSKGLTFHAIWVASAGDLQTWTGCSSLTSGQVTALTDSRDSQTYAVAKLADDKCWTIENMRYKPTAGTETTSFSNVTSTSYQQYSLTNINRTKDPLAVSSQGSPYYQWYSYGGQYSWLSSINTTTNNSSQYYNYNTSSSSYATTGTTMAARNATDAVKNANICPAGWRLPRVAYNGYINASAGSDSDFPYLNNALNGSYGATSTFTGSNNWRKYPNNFVFAGGWNGANATNRGTRGYYWSSSVYNSSYAYYLYFYSTNVDPAGNSSKRFGFSVRCVYSAD